MAHNQIEQVYQRKHFAAHWSMEVVNAMLEKGDLFKAMFRVNAHNRVEAYCNIDGLPVDVLINGFHSQNRAIEGDIVAIKVDPLSSWTKMKGSIEASRNTSVDANTECVSNTNDGNTPDLDHLTPCSSSEKREPITLLEKLCTMINSFPSKRPTGKVVAIIDGSPRRKTVVGFLRIKQWLFSKEGFKDTKKNKLPLQSSKREYIQLISTDPKFPKMMMVPVKTLPNTITKRLNESDLTLETELVAGEIFEWGEDYDTPCAHITRVFGKGADVNSQISAILFQNSIDSSDFPPEVISCVPQRISEGQFRHRKDLRNVCTFTVDPTTASDLDDALSVEKLQNNIYRIGVHIADVSHFVLPHTALDSEAQTRSTSVYLLKSKIPMLPSLLSENVGSLMPGVERLAFSMMWDVNLEGEILDRWIGRTVIQSCCKLSYSNAQDILDSISNMELESLEVHGRFTLSDVVNCVKNLYKISEVLKEKRFKEGALSLEIPKLVFLFDENGIPYDTDLSGRIKSNFLVEEFMLLANKTAAEVITRAYPSNSLLRRHPEPKLSKLKDLEAFCGKHGLGLLNTSTSRLFHQSLECIRNELKDDSVLFHVLLSYATRPMQLATYFCSGDLVDGVDDFGHYALAVPLYTHFTSPLRRYPDIIVHRTLAAVLEVEENLKGRWFTGLYFEKEVVEKLDAQNALADAAMKYDVLCMELLADVATHCNERKLASRYAKDATDKVYMWLMLRNKEVFLSEARVLGLGPRFMSVYVTKLAMERRIYYDEVEGLTAEYLDVTSTLVLTYCPSNRSHKKGSTNKLKTIEEVAMVTFPDNVVSDLNISEDNNSSGSAIEPAVFPLVLRLLSTIPVALHPIGGDDGPIDIGARLYMTSYFC